MKAFLQSWEGLMTAIVGAVFSTAAAIAYVPKFYKAAKAFAEGVSYILNLKEDMSGMRAEMKQGISDLKSGHAKLIQSRQLLFNADETTAYFETDSHGKMLTVSKKFVDWTGIDFNQARGAGWENGISSKDRIRILQSYQLAIDHQRNWEDKFFLTDRHGFETEVMACATPIRDDAGEVMTFFGYFKPQGVQPETDLLGAARPSKL